MKCSKSPTQLIESEVVDVPDMTFSSSPIEYPLSSSPVLTKTVTIPKQKRRLFQTLNAQEPISKKQKLSEDGLLPRIFEETEHVRSPFVNEDEEDVSHDTAHRPTEHEPTSNLARNRSANVEDIDDLLPEPSFSAAAPLDLGRGLSRKTVDLKTASGTTLRLATRKRQPIQTYEQVIAERSTTAAGKATRAYYGVHIHELIDEAKIQYELDAAAREVAKKKEEEVQQSIEHPVSSYGDNEKRSNRHQMWTEKYRAKKFTELVGDERTHRSVLRWLKAWDTIVFPKNVKKVPKRVYEDKDAGNEQQHRKIMLLTGPPGLGKTTLAHVCAKQAGYEVLEINASDDRSRDVVKGRIKDALGTETVRGIREPGKSRKAGRPVCVVVDEVDGVVTGSGGSGGEGGFMKALIDLVQLDQKNSLNHPGQEAGRPNKKKGDKFRQLRPLILICNDVYAPSLRPLRNSSIAEIVHVRKPPLDKVINRLKVVFEKENIKCDNDAVRRLCEDSWGVGTRKQGSQGARGAGDGDIRGVLVQGEWMAHKLRSQNIDGKLSRKWIEEQISQTASKGPKGLGRGGVREVVERVFIEGAGLPITASTSSADEARLIRESKGSTIGIADLRKRAAITALREMIDTCGDHDRVMTDCFTTYATHTFQDDTFLSKPNTSYDWLHFHDSLSSRIFSGQEWELTPYLSTGACAFHTLFSNVDKGASAWSNENEKHETEENMHPFSGAKADFAAYEAEKATRTVLTEIQSNFSAELLRLYSSTAAIATEMIPNVSRIFSPDIKPVVVGGSGGLAAVASVRRETEKSCVRSAVRVMNALGVTFEMVKIESEGYGSTVTGGYALRMEPPVDTLSMYHISTSSSGMKTGAGTTQPTRYAIRQVLDQELRKEKILQASLIRQARGRGDLISNSSDNTTENKENIQPKVKHIDVGQTIKAVKRDFFGRPIATVVHSLPTPPPEGTKIDAGAIAKSTALKGKARTTTAGGSGGDQGGDVEGGRIWVSFHEGFSNAVRKPITLRDLMDGF